MPTLQDRVAIVTGAGRGIGRGIALEFGLAGANVMVASRTSSTVDDVVKEISTSGGNAIGLQVDVGVEEEVTAMVARAVAEWGHVDILVNNAQSLVPDRRLEQVTNEDWDQVLRTGVLATFWSMKAVVPLMRERRWGRVINFGSMGGQMGMFGMTAYNANKEAIRGLSRTAARELGRFGITVNVINPVVMSPSAQERRDIQPEAYDRTLEQIPVGRWGTDRDAGHLAVFLASEEASYLTGGTYQLDGGLTMSS